VTRVRYEDPFVPAEFGATYGDYRCSYRYDDGLVEVRLFTTSDNTWLAFLTKTPGFPMREAQAFADDAFRAETSRNEHVRIVMDPFSFATGSV
jgi:hypothetical protein